MKHQPLDPNRRQSGIYASDQQTTVDVGDVIRLEHSDGHYYAEVIAIETGDAGELLIYEYIEPSPDFETAPSFKINRAFPK